MPSANPAAADGGSNAPPPERNVAPSFLRRRDEGAAATVAASGMPHTTGSQPHNNNNTSPGSTTSNASIHNNHGGVPRPPHKASHSSTTNNNSATTTTAFFFEGLQQHPPPPPLTGIAATTTTTMRRKKVPHSSPHQQQQQHQYPNDDQASIERASTFSSIESAPDPHHLLTMDQHPPNLPTAFSSPPSVGTSSYTSHSPNNNRPSGMRRNGVVVAVNPLESEAETLILKALEHQEAKGRARADTDISTSNSVLAPNLPSDALRKAFLPVPDEDRLEAAGVSNQASAATVRRPSLASLLSHHTNDQPAFLHAAAADAQPTTFRGNNSNATTTEGALAKLTMMIEALDQQKHQQQLLDQTVSTSGGGDAFSQNANLVLHGRRRQSTLLPPATSTEVAPPSSNGAYVTQNWSKLRYAVQMTGALKDGTGGFPSSSAADLADDHHHGSNNDKTTSQDVEHGEGIKINDQGAAAEVDGADCTGGSSSDETSNQPAGAPVTNGKPLPEKELKAVAASATTKNKRRGKKKKNGASTKGAVQDLQVFCSKRRNLFFVYVNFLLFMMVPATGVAAILFYLAGTSINSWSIWRR